MFKTNAQKLRERRQALIERIRLAKLGKKTVSVEEKVEDTVCSIEPDAQLLVETSAEPTKAVIQETNITASHEGPSIEVTPVENEVAVTEEIVIGPVEETKVDVTVE